jgi:hypothetical protein
MRIGDMGFPTPGADSWELRSLKEEVRELRKEVEQLKRALSLVPSSR